MPLYLTREDLNRICNPKKLTRYFVDDGFSTLEDDNENLVEALDAGEDHVFSLLLGAWSQDGIVALMETDRIARRYAAWCALALGAERRDEFLNPDGTGPFNQQLLRANEHFKRMKAGRARSKGEPEGGRSANIGGKTQPAKTHTEEPNYTFAPDKTSPSGHGGF